MQQFHGAQFLKLSIVYVSLGSVLTCLIHPLGIDYMLSMLHSPQFQLKKFATLMPVFSGLVILGAVATRVFLDKERIKLVFIVFGANLLFMSGFSMFKSLLPYIIPFWADPLLAGIDKAIHFGVHPWELVNPLREPLGTEIVDYIYLHFWAWAGVAGPVLLVLFDRNRERISRFLVLYCFAWIFLGNILAGLFMSGGPVYMDRLFGTEEFAALHAVLQTEAEQASIMGRMREWLWIVNQDGFRGISSGISAFPSLHVAIAAIAMLYFAERSKLLVLPGVAFFLFTLMASTLTGLHYAIDGYVSLALVALLWAYLRRRSDRTAPLLAPDAKAQQV